MLLYTIYDPNLIFNNQNINDTQANTSYCETNVDGIMVQVSHDNNNDFCIERVISTNPADYLNPKLQPGSIIQNSVK